MKKLAAIVGIAGLLIGALIGYLAVSQTSRKTGEELAAIRGSLSAQQRRSDELQSKLAEAESRVKTLTVELDNERALRQKYEDLVNRGRK
jgi:uncharacterized membrane-anchored protein YhcB (DUF1043 family)